MRGSVPVPLYLPAPALHELYYGAARASRRDDGMARIGVLERSMLVLPFDMGAARIAGTLEADLEAGGRKPGRADVQIAAMALAHGERVLTRDRRFPRAHGLTVESY